MPSTWDAAPIIEVRLPPKPACPHCGETSYVPIEGRTDSDGVRTSKRVCKECSERYIVISSPSLGEGRWAEV